MKGKNLGAIILLFCAVAITCYACTRYSGNNRASSKLVPDSTIYSFLNEITKDQNGDYPVEIITDQLSRRPMFFSSKDSIEIMKSFSNEDIKFITEQFKGIYNFKLQPKYLPTKKIISSKSVDSLRMIRNKVDGDFWTKFINKYGARAFSEISMPLFTKNGNIAIVRITHYCNGLCGDGGIYVYHSINHKWVVIKVFDNWYH